ncbi:hypothetical protein ACQPZX_26815 [Actinoplanes sp. CA-142083]|uniref:hypothetical protein n=1 Tax=Actinoplanes sp. CA-142083 TaxID=3239903 RepID=UPI003D94B050
MRRIAPWLIAIAFYGLLAPLGLADIDNGWQGWALPVLTAVLCIVPLIVAHEGGHLLAALLLRMPVAGVRIRFPDASFVRVSLPPAARAPRLRFVLLHLAGPLVNIALAYGLYRYAVRDDISDLTRSCALTVAFLSIVMGIGNLLPHRDRSGLHSDGAQIWRWIAQPTTKPDERTAGVKDETIGDADLDAFIEAAPNVSYRVAGVYLRLRRTLGLTAGDPPPTVDNFTIGQAAAADYEFLRVHVLGPGATPAMLDGIAPMLALIPGLGELHRVTAGGTTPDPAALARVAQVRRAISTRPVTLQRRLVGAIGDLLEDRPAEARSALAEVAPSAGTDVAWALILRAVAESMLGNHAEADRTIDALRRAHNAQDASGEDLLPPVFAEILAATSPGAARPAAP